VQGVIAHELGHITGGHIIRMQEGVKVATGIMILSLVLGAAAMAAGAGEAGMGVLAAGQQAAMGKFLAFSRTQESSADAGRRELPRQGRRQRQGQPQLLQEAAEPGIPLRHPAGGQLRPHPPADRRAHRRARAGLKNAPGWNRSPIPALEARFQRVKAKLSAMSRPRAHPRRYPESNKSVPARYARAYAWHKSAYPEKALAEADSLARRPAARPLFPRAEGPDPARIGPAAEALESLREAVKYAPDQPLIAALLGHALISTEKPDNFEEAKQVLAASAATMTTPSPGTSSASSTTARATGRAALATAERYNLQGEPQARSVNASRR
jgi:predicted Zn-dependent protease